MSSTPNCILFFSPTEYAKAIFHSDPNRHHVDCLLAQPLLRSEGGNLIDVNQSVNIDGDLQQEKTLDLSTNPAQLISLWHDETLIYDPVTEQKPFILTLTSEDEQNFKEINDHALHAFTIVLER